MPLQSVNQFRESAHRWLSATLPPRPTRAATAWGEGSDSVAVFHAIDPVEERELLRAQGGWQARKFAAGFGAIALPVSVGGAGLTKEHALAFTEEEASFLAPPSSELVRVTLGLVVPTLVDYGSKHQLATILPKLLRGESWVCQLFSEPDAGSDLASVNCRATSIDGGWEVTGQKVWTSGAQFADLGLLLARTSADGHRGITAFVVPLSAKGVAVRPIRQMTGGSSFNEVFLDRVVLDDAARLGDVGDGWRVALRVLEYEREVSGESYSTIGGSIERLTELGQRLGMSPATRSGLIDACLRTRVLQLLNRRVSSGAVGTFGGSLVKLMWSDNLRRIGEVAANILGARLTADDEAWGTYCWTEHVLGAPGFRIAGGSDEIQRNIIAERGLGLPREPRVTPIGGSPK